MSDRPPRPAPNPFATRYTRPGCVLPLDASGRPVDVPSLVHRLQERAWRGAIIGPHGSGKTNLLSHVAAALADRPGSRGPLRARSGRDALAILRSVLDAPPGVVVCIDSWEQLGVATRLALRAATAWRRCGLLVTSHMPVALPTLVACHASREVLAAIVTRLPDAGGGIASSDIDDLFTRHAGNIRDALAELYDRFEARRHEAPQQPSATPRPSAGFHS